MDSPNRERFTGSAAAWIAVCVALVVVALVLVVGIGILSRGWVPCPI